jgi:hypothetical protein
MTRYPFIVCFLSPPSYFAVSTSAESHWPTSSRSDGNVEPFTRSHGSRYGDSGGLPLGEPPGGAASCIPGVRARCTPLFFRQNSARAHSSCPPLLCHFDPALLVSQFSQTFLTGLRMKEAGRCGASVLRRLRQLISLHMRHREPRPHGRPPVHPRSACTCLYRRRYGKRGHDGS